jgi:transcriptional regulator NrdR family protein
VIYCPTCGGETVVTETRATRTYARRRRICKAAACRLKITTLEAITPTGGHASSLVMIKRQDLEAMRRLVERMSSTPIPDLDQVT